jgi:predicted dehydrogenase
MRALVVGLGSIGRRHARNWAALGLGPLAICRVRRDPLPEPLGVEASEYHDLDHALEVERPEVVLVTNPTSLHVQTACSAVQAGAHVLVEKPLGSTLEAVPELLELARAGGRMIMVGYNLRFHPGLARLKALVDDGAIGRIVSARAEVGEYLADWHPWEDYRQGYAARRELGGGAVLTFSHELDALCWLLGAPRKLVAMAGRRGSLEVDAEDVAEIAIDFEGGALGSIHVDFVRRPPRRSIELVGEKGVLRWEFERNRLEQYSVGSGQWRVELGDARFERNQMYREELRHFAGCVRGEISRPLVDGEQGAAVLAIALAALHSAAEGRAIDFRDADSVTRAWLARLGSRGQAG